MRLYKSIAYISLRQVIALITLIPQCYAAYQDTLMAPQKKHVHLLTVQPTHATASPRNVY